MLIFNQLLMLLGVLLFVVGLGFALRFFSYMIRGVQLPWAVFFQVSLIGSFGLSIGLLLILLNYVAIRGSIF